MFRHGSETLESPAPSADVSTKRKSEELVSREEMQTYVKRAIDESTHMKRDPISKFEHEGGLMTIGREGISEMMSRQEKGIREIMMHQEIRHPPPPNINIVTKEALGGFIWHRLYERMEYNIKYEVTKKGKTISPQVRDLIMSYHELIVNDVERLLPDELYMDIVRFKNDIIHCVGTLHTSFFVELERLSGFNKDHLSETEVNELKVRNKTAVRMCARAIATFARQVVSPPQPKQTIERLIQEPEETGTHVPEKEDTVRPVDAETLRLRKEQVSDLRRRKTTLE